MPTQTNYSLLAFWSSQGKKKVSRKNKNNVVFAFSLIPNRIVQYLEKTLLSVTPPHCPVVKTLDRKLTN